MTTYCSKCDAERSARRLTDILTQREMFLVKLLADGFSNKEIAVRTQLSFSYIRLAISRIYGKLGFAVGTARLEPRIIVAIRYDREQR